MTPCFARAENFGRQNGSKCSGGVYGTLTVARRNFMTRVPNGSATRREPWCSGPPTGPGVEACHIITQHHHHVYPEVWQSTWSLRNAILLMKHLHEFFDAQLFSIHPHTLHIRVFALRHHYDMSCIENMTADRPILDAISPSISRMISGTATPVTAMTDLPATPTSGESGNRMVGGPSERQRRNHPDQSR
ncbi:Dual specificity protein kinase lkh1 [Fusarium oxysporum f. sp. albedinis]|nr:Dual specificity protein kinase lkh1 [Fusarium oxysporum f. sp. albedinis]